MVIPYWLHHSQIIIKRIYYFSFNIQHKRMSLKQFMGRVPAMIMMWVFVILYIIATVMIAWDDYISGSLLMFFSLIICGVSFWILNITVE